MLYLKPQGRLAKFFFNPHLWHDSLFSYAFLISFTFFVIGWGETIWALFALQNVNFITLHYTIYFGVDWIGSVYGLFIFSGTITAVFLINYILALLFYEKKKAFSYLLAFSTPLVILFILVGATIMIYANWASPIGQ